MIEAATSCIAGQLNQFLRRTFGLNEDVVVISNILEQDGNVASHINNKLVVFLTNIEKDAVCFRDPIVNTAGADRSATRNPPVYLNLYLMIAGYFSGENYS